MTQLFLSTKGKTLGLLLSICLLLTSFFLSVRLGQMSVEGAMIIDTLFRFDENVAEHVIIYERFSRAVTAALIGSSLAVSGGLLQALTRNPLASPGIFGINAGALFFVVFAVAFLSVSSLSALIWIAFAGAGIAAVIVLLLGLMGTDGLSPIRIVLAGTAVTALFTSFTQGMLVVNEANLDQMLLWMAGTVSGRTVDVLLPVLPLMIGALFCSFLLAKPVNILTSGDDIAKGLGQKTMAVKLALVLIAVLLAGGSVAIGGMIGFIGLIVPHIVRALVGNDHFWLLPYCVSLGASLLIFADLIARFIIMPQEMPIGIMTALIGAPFFIYIARKGFRKE
ncbi:FecCD family ABC transporter permease [Salicibibacter kimchii]|uniref:Iron ABC transporter permease n=1 Tax=Salicibibacter kimchii TaxID=2099786 RepID=A0A345C1M8_9BACI|nr:iron ABC transporter permease [Salicibibacter kimchii]AXF57109.1 iron ABC transporter permease [Salicibibacter kimchii]